MDKQTSGHFSSPGRFRQRGAGTLAKAVTIAASALLLCAAFVFSLLLFAVLAVGGLLAWGYLWWKTRSLRHEYPGQQPNGRLIEGEVIRDAEDGDDVQR